MRQQMIVEKLRELSLSFKLKFGGLGKGQFLLPLMALNDVSIDAVDWWDHAFVFNFDFDGDSSEMRDLPHPITSGVNVVLDSWTLNFWTSLTLMN